MRRRMPSLVTTKGSGGGAWRLPGDGIREREGREDRAPGSGEGPAGVREHGPLLEVEEEEER